jgi:hypothetical protein
MNILRRSTPAALTAMLAAAGAAVTSFMAPPPASADATAYLINVTVRPGYNFANPADALGYGHRLCDTITAGSPYAAVMGKVKADFQTSDDYQAAYLINQAVNELCPAQIWQLRRSAAGYKPPSGSL